MRNLSSGFPNRSDTNKAIPFIEKVLWNGCYRTHYFRVVKNVTVSKRLEAAREGYFCSGVFFQNSVLITEKHFAKCIFVLLETAFM